MAISKKEMYHGAVLYQVVGNPDFSLKLIERDKEEHGYGMYEVTTNTNEYVIFIKYRNQTLGAGSTNVNSFFDDGNRRNVRIPEDGRSYCTFSFLPRDIKRLNTYKDKNLLICLVCHNKHICALTQEDIEELKLLQNNGSCNVTVSWQKNSELKVKSKYSELRRTIPRNRLKNFPWDQIFFSL